MISAPPATACPRCGGSAPRGFLFCLACAVGLFEADESGWTLYDALVTEHQELVARISDGEALLRDLSYGPRREKAEAKLLLWKRQRKSLAYVLAEWQV